MTAQPIEGAGTAEQVLVRSTNWIGDTIMSLAALRELRRLLPQAYITVFARKWVSDIYLSLSSIDRVVIFDDRASYSWWLEALKGHDRAILFQNAFKAALLVFLARIPERVGYATQHRPFLLTKRAVPRIAKLGRHQVFYYLDLLYQTGLSPVDYVSESFEPDIRIRATAAAQKEAERVLEGLKTPSHGPIVGLNPGAYFGPAKRWFADRYASLADLLIDQLGASVLIFGSAGEEKLAQEISHHMRFEPYILTGQTDLQTLIGLIARCRLFVTNDSGPMHLAAALDIPQIALFGSTDEIATGPYSAQASVIHKYVECSPCLRRECPIDLHCFTSISVDEVFRLARKVLES